MHIIIIAARGNKQIRRSCTFMDSWFNSQPNYINCITLEALSETWGKREFRNCSKWKYPQVQANAMENLISSPQPFDPSLSHASALKSTPNSFTKRSEAECERFNIAVSSSHIKKKLALFLISIQVQRRT